MHLSLCFRASVSYQWSEQIATASMPRAHKAKERPAYSSNLPAAIPQLHGNTMDIFTTAKALEREATPKPRSSRRPSLGRGSLEHPLSCGSHPRCGRTPGALRSRAPRAVLGAHRPPLPCGGDAARRSAAFLPPARADVPPPSPRGRRSEPRRDSGATVVPLISMGPAGREARERWLSAR